MNKLQFVFTQNSFHIDDTTDLQSEWSSHFKNDKYSAYTSLAFKMI